MSLSVGFAFLILPCVRFLWSGVVAGIRAPTRTGTTATGEMEHAMCDNAGVFFCFGGAGGLRSRLCRSRRDCAYYSDTVLAPVLL